jgi:hypothetical protein
MMSHFLNNEVSKIIKEMPGSVANGTTLQSKMCVVFADYDSKNGK